MRIFVQIYDSKRKCTNDKAKGNETECQENLKLI